MARNIEIEARIAGVQALAPIAAALATEGPAELAQDDTFFRCESGRLKLRTFSDTEGELIFYKRADESAEAGCQITVIQEQSLYDSTIG